MDSQIEFSPKAIYQIANIMATQNSADPNWGSDFFKWTQTCNNDY